MEDSARQLQISMCPKEAAIMISLFSKRYNQAATVDLHQYKRSNLLTIARAVNNLISKPETNIKAACPAEFMRRQLNRLGQLLGHARHYQSLAGVAAD